MNNRRTDPIGRTAAATAMQRADEAARAVVARHKQATNARNTRRVIIIALLCLWIGFGVWLIQSIAAPRPASPPWAAIEP